MMGKPSSDPITARPTRRPSRSWTMTSVEEGTKAAISLPFKSRLTQKGAHQRVELVWLGEKRGMAGLLKEVHLGLRIDLTQGQTPGRGRDRVIIRLENKHVPGPG